jgi:hypothetical protein
MRAAGKSIPVGRPSQSVLLRNQILLLALLPQHDRGDDITLLVEHHLKRFGRKLGWPYTL